MPVIAGTGANIHRVRPGKRPGCGAPRRGRSADGDPLLQQGNPAGLFCGTTRSLPIPWALPMILYNVPSRTGVNIQPETYAELAQAPQHRTVSRRPRAISANMQKTRNLCPEDFAIWSGNDDETAAICMLGGPGSSPWWPTSSPQKCTG